MSNAVACIKIACDFVSMENLKYTLQVASELHLERLCSSTGQDVLQLFTTLYYAFVALRTIQPSSPFTAHAIPNNNVDHSSPMAIDLDLPFTATVRSHAFGGDSITHSHIGSTAGVDFSLPEVATGGSAPTLSHPHGGGITMPDPKMLHKQQKRREKRRAKLTEAPSHQKKGFGFGCPLCPRRFIRSGVINHL